MELRVKNSFISIIYRFSIFNFDDSFIVYTYLAHIALSKTLIAGT